MGKNHQLVLDHLNIVTLSKFHIFVEDLSKPNRKGSSSSPTIETQEPSALKLRNFKVMLGAERKPKGTLLCDWSALEGFHTHTHIYLGCENCGVYVYFAWEFEKAKNLKTKTTQKKCCLQYVHPKMDECKCKPERMQWINCTTVFKLVSSNTLRVSAIVSKKVWFEDEFLNFGVLALSQG